MNILFGLEVLFLGSVDDSRSLKTGYPSPLIHTGLIRTHTAQNALRMVDLGQMNHLCPPTTPHADPMGCSPLNDAHLSMLGSSVLNAKPVRKAAGYARISGWMTLMAGVVSVLFSLTSMPGLILGVALAAIGMRELGLARRLDALDDRAPAGLAINQLFLGGALIAYAVFKAATYDSADSILAGSLGSDPTIASMPEMAGTIQELGQLEYLLTLGVSGVLIVVAFVMQGGTALYYWNKRKRVRTLQQHTPGWVLEVHQVMSDPKAMDAPRRAA